MFNSRVWRHFGKKVARALLFMVGLLAYLFLVAFSGAVVANYYDISANLAINIAMLVGILLPTVGVILYFEFRESQRKIEAEDEAILRRLRK